MTPLAWMATLPGLPHRMAHGDSGAESLRALASLGGALEGERLVGRGTLEDALALAGQQADGLSLGVVVGPVSDWWDAVPTGIGAHRLRLASQLARTGEVLALPGIGAVPDGVGRFDAPSAIAEAVGCPVEVLRDYR